MMMKSLVLCAVFVVEIVNCLQGDHICYNEESYVELEQKRTTQPIRVRSHNWCFGFPPRCSNYRTEIKEIIKLQNVTKTRIIEQCCVGYTDTAVDNTTVCLPVCRGGCGQGFCNLPNSCFCNIGYEGRHCTQRCGLTKYGQNCKKYCKCRNGALCDHKNGYCRCTEGWIGDFCQIPCSPGLYGIMCKNVCECSSNKCNPQTGECVTEDSQILFGWSDSMPSNIMKLSHNRIKAKHWIQVNGNGKINLKNCTYSKNCDFNEMYDLPGSEDTKTQDNLEKQFSNSNVDDKIVSLIGETHQHHVQIQKNNTILMNALNSSIANLTSDIGKLSKQVSDQQSEIKRANVDSSLPQVAILLESPILTQSEIEQLPDVAHIHTTNIHKLDSLIAFPNGYEHSVSAPVEQFQPPHQQQLSIIETNDDNIVHNVIQNNERNNEARETDSNRKEIVHVLTSVDDDVQTNHTMVDKRFKSEMPQMIPVVLIFLIILIIVSLTAFGILYVVRRDNDIAKSNARKDIILTDHVIQKPLPDIPSFTQSIARRITQQDYYDRPTNNSSVKINNFHKFGYSYTTDVNLGMPQASTSRKHSVEHIYDEINYTNQNESKR